MKTLCIILATALLTSTAWAQDVAVTPAEEVTPTPAPPQHRWMVTEERSPLDDSLILTMTVMSSSVDEKMEMLLVLRFRDHEWNAFLACGEYLGYEDPKVSVRFDKEPPQTSRVDSAKDHKAAFSRDPKGFIQRLLKAHQLVARLSPEFRGPVTGTFDVSGLAEELDKFPDAKAALASAKKAKK